jgi:hypothetical protein
MQPLPDIESLFYEYGVIPPVQLINFDAPLTLGHLASVYSVSRNTMNDRSVGMRSRRDTHPN